MYDVAIIGAGINGSSVAYEFIRQGKKVILFDMNSIAAGGSGAAGAFISPKFSKSGELKELIDKAFVYSMEFYEKNFPHLFTKATLIHRSQNNEEKYTLESGMVDAEKMCKALCEGATFKKQKVESLYFDGELWNIDAMYSAKNIVLAIGAYEQIIKEPYIQLRGIWGHRIDIKTSSENKDILHQFVSISPSKDGMLSIGATHNVHYHPETSKEPYDLEQGRAELLEKASRMIDLENVEVVKDYTGLRPGSNDYIPLVGSLVISKETLASKSIQFQRKNPDYTKYVYYPHLYMINGNAGYGFVLAPYLAKILQEHILSNKSIDERLVPARFFARWARKL